MTDIISNPKAFFYYLGSKNSFDFSFDSKNNNYLKNCYDVSVQFVDSHDLMRNVDGNLADVSSKFKIHLQGSGQLKLFDKIFYFASSAFVLPFDKINNRNVCFNHFFDENEIPFENKENNLHLNNNDKFALPILKTHIVQKSIKNDSWALVLEEI